MIWTPEYAKAAAAEGWRLVETIDNGTKHPYLMVSVHGGRFRNEHEAGIHVVRSARLRSGLHQTALRAIVQSRVQPVKAKAKR